MTSQAFVDSVMKEIVQPGVEQLMLLPYFTELRAGKLSAKRLQGWALQHYLHNIALLKGFALCMVKNSHDPDLFKCFLYQMNSSRNLCARRRATWCASRSPSSKASTTPTRRKNGMMG